MNSIIPSIMQSIKPQYCELIAAGRKTYEVRKTRPKIETPFKVYMYETKFINHCKNCEYCSFEAIVMSRMEYVCTLKKDNWKITSPSSRCFQNKYSGGKVIGEYICDEIIEITFDNEYTHSYDISDDDLKLTCLTQEQLWEYGKGKALYLYHISNLKIYDEPKELSEFAFARHCFNFKNVSIVQNSFGDYVAKYSENSFCRQCPHLEDGWCEKIDGQRQITRPPQSWCYCVEV